MGARDEWLLVIDMQRVFADPPSPWISPDFYKVLPSVERLVDAYRGRVNALDFVVGAGGPQLGNIRAGLVASVSSGSESMILGGLAAAIGTVLIAVFTPQLRRYRLGDDPVRARAPVA